MNRLRSIAGALAVVGAASACAGPRSFGADRAIRIISPAPLSSVTAPFAVAWTGARAGDASYAVFVDRPPIGPGGTVRDVADASCRHQSGCPGPEYLAGRGVYLTVSRQVEVTHLDPPGGTAGRAPHPVHTVTVIALDGEGRRRGDVAWEVEVRG